MRHIFIKITAVFFTLLFTISFIPTSSSVTFNEVNSEYKYYTYQEMTDLLKNIQNQNKDIMKLESYGKTHENRDIWFVKISDNVDVDEKEPGVLLIGALHGDEKISYEILIFFIKHITDNYSKENTDNDNDGFINEDPIDGIDNDQDGSVDEDPSEERVREAIDNTQIYILPMVNPDGVEADIRKNCNPDSRHGVNINRNFGYDWKYYDLFPKIFANRWTDSETSGNYKGPAPYSENETKVVKKVAESFTINISLSYHSGAEVVFYPWYHTTAKTPHEDLFIEIGEDMEKISGYPLWTGSNTFIPKLGGTLGTSENFLYGEHNILAYTVESARIKSPTNEEYVYNLCYKNVGVHLYLCEKAQIVDNKELISNQNIEKFQNFLNLFNHLFHFLK